MDEVAARRLVARPRGPHVPSPTSAAVTTYRRADETAVLELERLGPGFGAVVHDVDLTHLDEARVRAVRRALLAHKVLFFRGQDLSDDAQVTFAARLGELTAGHPVA